jgi:hypothetical protein
MDETNLEITRTYDGIKVNVDHMQVWLRDTRVMLDHEEARAVGKAIADYDKAIAALGYAK